MNHDQSEAELPPASIGVIVEQLTIQAMAQLGRIPNPVTGKSNVSLDRARFTIDLLQVLRQKTRGNLEAEEEEHIDTRIGELQTTFIQIAPSDFGDD